METLQVILLFLALAVAAFLIRAMIVEKRRVAGLRRVAAQLGLTFEPGPFFQTEMNGEGLNLLQSMRGGYKEWDANVIKGLFKGLPFKAYEHSRSYQELVQTTNHTRSQQVKRRTTTTGRYEFTLPKVLPQFSLSHEGLLQKVSQKLGAQDIDFPDTPDFSSTYVLRGGDEGAVRKLFTRDVRRSLLGINYAVSAKEKKLLFETSLKLQPEGFAQRISELAKIARLFS